jgi:hypothetical protein
MELGRSSKAGLQVIPAALVPAFFLGAVNARVAAKEIGCKAGNGVVDNIFRSKQFYSGNGGGQGRVRGPVNTSIRPRPAKSAMGAQAHHRWARGSPR